jgi:hypothetical protein
MATVVCGIDALPFVFPWRPEIIAARDSGVGSAIGGAMLRSAVIAFSICVSLLAANPLHAQFSNSGVPGAQQGDVHAPWSGRYLPLLPNQPIQYGSSTSISVGFGGGSFYYGNNLPVWGYGSYPYWYDPYPYGGAYYPGPIVLPPLYLPAEQMYGPQAVRQFMGLNNPAPAQNVIIANKLPDLDAGDARPRVRISNMASKAQAGKFIAFGDALFFKQNYNSALERYRSASLSASDLPETYLRQGFALVAMGRYESAAKVMRRGLLLQNDPSRLTMRLDQLYKENRAAKSAHLESLAREVEGNPQSADLLLLLGLQLFFDGQPDRAAPVFERCKQLDGNEDGAITGFLNRAPGPAPADAAPVPAVPAPANGRDI